MAAMSDMIQGRCESRSKYGSWLPVIRFSLISGALAAYAPAGELIFLYEIRWTLIIHIFKKTYRKDKRAGANVSWYLKKVQLFILFKAF